ncbi:hypothetical protein [Franconibacter helveticus]|uniref:hypothetical protein n=1 Tax=Franconibacter helveticus TaxID=357240 RepID=UPI001113037F|nr:hypothetical protein [Franconibacter helveticus]
MVGEAENLRIREGLVSCLWLSSPWHRPESQAKKICASAKAWCNACGQQLTGSTWQYFWLSSPGHRLNRKIAKSQAKKTCASAKAWCNACGQQLTDSTWQYFWLSSPGHRPNRKIAGKKKPAHPRRPGVMLVVRS